MCVQVTTRLCRRRFFSLRVVSRKKVRKIEYQQATYKKRIRFAVEFLLSYGSLNSRKRRTFHTASYLQGQWKYGKAKEAVESARAGLLLLEESVRKLGREKKKTKKGEKVAPAKATFLLP